MEKQNNSLAWVDPALAVEHEVTEADRKAADALWQPAGDTECKNCGRVSPFVDIYFDYCRHCLRDAHPEQI